MRTALALLLCTASVAAADDNPIAVLMRLRDRVLEQGGRMPNHTCVETVERARYERVAETASRSCDDILARRALPNYRSLLRLSTTDRLRLDVAFTWDHEIYSWAAAGRFEEGDVDDVVHYGAIGSGSFGSLLMSAFGDRTPDFAFEGETSARGRSAFEYSFHVPTVESHYSFKHLGHSVITGYTGSLLVDARTSDLLRFTVRTDELPAETASCESDLTLDYSTVRLNDADFLLPIAARQQIVAHDGSESENSYSFSNCRDFQADSSIDFERRHAAAPAQLDSPATSPEWPGGLPVTIELSAAIDLSTAAAGDVIQGRLAKELVNPRAGTTLPAGTRVKGRLMRVETRHVPSLLVTVALQWESLDLNGRSVPLVLASDRVVQKGAQFQLPPAGELRWWTLNYPTDHQLIEPGLRTQWLTTTR